MDPIHSQAEADIATERARCKRLILAWSDLNEAREALNRLLGLNGKTPPAPGDFDLTRALITSLVIAYGRMFRQTRGSAGVPGHLPQRVIGKDELQLLALHSRVLKLRDQEFAHSDAEVADVRISVERNNKFLLPQHRVLRAYSLNPEDLAQLNQVLQRVHAYIYDELARLGPILVPHGDF